MHTMNLMSCPHTGVNQDLNVDQINTAVKAIVTLCKTFNWDSMQEMCGSKLHCFFFSFFFLVIMNSLAGCWSVEYCRTHYRVRNLLFLLSYCRRLIFKIYYSHLFTCCICSKVEFGIRRREVDRHNISRNAWFICCGKYFVYAVVDLCFWF